MFKNTIVEMDRAAKALDLHDIDTAALCLRKAVESREEMSRPEPTPDAHETGIRAELLKAVTALELKNYNLAAMCLEKTVEQVEGRIAEEAIESAKRLANAIRREQYSAMADSLRGMVEALIGDCVVEPVPLPN
jgi:single-stranded DNA-specific DHH superfamily exonuclease